MANRVNLFYLHMPGCSACEAGMPVIKDFARSAKRGETIRPTSVVFVDLSKYNWSSRTIEITNTPTYILHVPYKKKIYKREGAVEDRSELRKWYEERI